MTQKPRGHLREMSSTPCPRCGGAYEKGALECGSCGLIFARMKKPGDMLGIATPKALEDSWQQVLMNFASEEEHLGFIDKCISSNNALFASQKYRQMIEANPSDEISIKMRDKIIQRVTTMYLSRIPHDDSQGVTLIQKVLFFVFGLGMIMAMLGLFFPGTTGKIIMFSGILFVVLAGGLLFATRET